MIYIKANSTKKSLNSDASYINMASLLFERNNIVLKHSQNDITEYGKVIEIDYNDIQISYGNALVDVTVTKTWKYDFSEIDSGAVDKYIFNLVYEDNKWKIENVSGLSKIVFDYRLQEMGDQITKEQKNDYLSIFEKEIVFNIENVKDAESLLSSRSGYNTSAATNYALTYALTPNTSYADFTNIGGDCTNFISQCLYAGGKNMHYGAAYTGDCWYYTTSTNRSSTWTGAAEFRSYVLSSNSQLGMSTSDWNNVSNGDIIQMLSSDSAYHSLIITGVAYSSYGRSDLLVCAHTTNRRHVSLNSYYSGTKAYYHVN
ncbi:MAG: amidase domain-containing protein [Lachnospiraceae bacterium]